jgi:VanZ family protein
MQREIRLPLLSRWVRWTLVVAAAAGIFYASVLAAPPASPDPGPIGVDKLYHAGGYFAFGLAVVYALADTRHSLAARLALVVAVPTLYGVGIELAQAFVPIRAFDPADAAANAAGAAAAAGLWSRVAPRVSFVGSDR